MNSEFNEDDFLQIYERNVDMVYRICYMFMKNKSDTEDAVQNTFIKLLNKNTHFNDLKHEKAWLIITASNFCKNSLKHWFRKFRDHYEDFSNRIQYRDHYDFEILDEVLSLPDKYKTVIYLYYYEGYTSIEISKILNTKDSTIRSQLMKGRKLLRKKLGGAQNDGSKF